MDLCITVMLSSLMPSRALRDFPGLYLITTASFHKICRFMSVLFSTLRIRRTFITRRSNFFSSSIHFDSPRIMVDIPPRLPSLISRVLIMGSGNFGSCLADHLADSEHRVSLWCRSAGVAESFNRDHKNPKYLKDHTFPESVEAIGPDLPESAFIEQMDVVLFAVPTQGLRCHHHTHPAIVVGDLARFCSGRYSRTSIRG
jgi:hypothetical protein